MDSDGDHVGPVLPIRYEQLLEAGASLTSIYTSILPVYRYLPHSIFFLDYEKDVISLETREGLTGIWDNL